MFEYSYQPVICGSEIGEGNALEIDRWPAIKKNTEDASRSDTRMLQDKEKEGEGILCDRIKVCERHGFFLWDSGAAGTGEADLFQPIENVGEELREKLHESAFNIEACLEDILHLAQDDRCRSIVQGLNSPHQFRCILLMIKSG